MLGYYCCALHLAALSSSLLLLVRVNLSPGANNMGQGVGASCSGDPETALPEVVDALCG